MGRKGLKMTGHNVHKRHLNLPCGKHYSGAKKTVDKLMKIHSKVCKICQQNNERTESSVLTDNSLSNLSNIRNSMETM